MCVCVSRLSWREIDLAVAMWLTDFDPVHSAKNAPARKPLYPKQFTIKRKDGKQGGYSDTLIGALS